MTDTQLVPYDLETAVIEELKAKYSDISIPPDDKDAYAMVMAGLRECRDIRLACDEWHKEKKAYILKAGKHYDTEKRRVHALVEPIETGLKETRKVEEDRLEAIKQAKIDAEIKRVEDIRAKIAAIREKGEPHFLFGKSSCTLTEIVTEMYKSGYNPDDFEGFEDQIKTTFESTVNAINDAIEKRKAFEAEEEARKVEAAALAKQKAEQEKESARLQAIADEQARAQKALDDEKAKLLADLKAEQERKDRKLFEAKAKEEARIQAEKDAKEAAERKIREAEEKTKKDAAKKARVEALMPDKEKLIAWADSITTDPGPDVKDPKAQKIVETYVYKLFDLAYCLRLDAEEL